MAELYHRGILGQKWGIRRFQNPDGTLTQAGKRRYGAENVASISSAKGIERRLNDLDQVIAYNRRDYGEASARSTKLSKKLTKLSASPKTSTGAIVREALDNNYYLKNLGLSPEIRTYKTAEKLRNSIQKKDQAEKYIEQGRRETTELLKKANQSGYKIDSQEWTRSVSRGKDVVLRVAMSAPLGIFGLSVLGTPTVEGRNYKIRGLRNG